MTRLLPLLLTGCLLGSDPLKGAPNVPTLDGDPVLVEPQPDDQGEVWAREGTRVVVDLRLVSPIDLDESEVRLDEGVLDCTQPDPSSVAYRCERVMDGTESNGPKGLAGTLAFDGATTTARLVTAPLLTADFIPPTGSCVLNPRAANANDAISFVVTPSEPLREPPAITPSASELSVTFREQVEGQFFYDVAGEPGVNLDGYTLTVEAFDRAGNPQRGSSLCEVEDRTGTLLGRGPALDGDVTLTAAPSVEVGGVPWVREGAVLTVSIPTAEPIDADASSVALSGLDLAPVADTPNSWTLTLDGTEGDGFKNLDAVLFDAAGNTLRVQRPAITRFDFTPPTADCVLSPREANGEQAVTFDVFASEPLDGGAPTVTPSDPRITLAGPTTTRNQHRYAISGPPGEDVVYTLDVQGTDLAGNPADGPLCPEEDASGAIRGRGPEVVGDIVVSLEPSVDIDGVPSARAGAELRVTIPTAQAVDPDRSIVSLSGVPLVHDDTQPGTWARTLDGTEGDGLKRLDARLFDAAGNTRQEIRDDVVRFDFTPPSGACSIAPNPANRAQKPIFSFTPNEPLLHGPQVFSPAVAVSAPALEGGRWTNELSGPPVGNVDYTLQITATDRVGNTASGDDVCPEADRQGQIFNAPPVATGVALSVSGPNTHTPASGPPRVGLGAEVEVTLTSDSELDPAATTVQVGEIRLTHTEGLTWRHTVAEGDLDGLKTLAVSLVDVAGNTAPADGAGQGVVIDLTPPEASCVLTPANANANDTITLDVFVSETLPAAPALDVGGAPLTASTPTLTGNRYRYTLTQTASANLSYQLSLTATDLVGNAQEGDSLCEPDNRSGTIQGVGPALQGAEVALTVAPSTYTDTDGRPWAKAGDTVTVTFDVVDPSALDTATSSVSLSGLDLTPDTAGTTWTVTLDGSEGDGAKNLNARLVDTAGNALVVTRTAITRFDFTPPAGACFLAPNPANGTQTVTFAFTPTEALDGPPVVTSPDVTLEDLAFDGTRWTARVVAPPSANTTYTVGIEATDVVGNTASDTDVCPEADRTGEVFAVPPALVGEPVLVATPSVDVSGTPRVRAGAIVEVTLTTTAPIDPATTTVSLSGLELSWTSGTTWTVTLDGSEGDGLKNLDLRLRDALGNTTAVLREGVIAFDFTPPDASCVLSPKVAGVGQTAVFEVRANEALAEASVSSSDPAAIVTAGTPTGNTQTFTIAPDGAVNVDYVLAISATDLVGNTATDLCPVDDRSGSLRNVAPALAADPVLTVAPSTYVDGTGRPWAKVADSVTVTLDPATPLDVGTTTVSLSGLPLAHQGGSTWAATLDGSEGDGAKDLRVELRDEAGNLTVVTRTNAVRFDFTPPTASCVLSPSLANANDTITLDVFVSEALAAVPDLDVGGAPLSAGSPTLTGNRYRYTLTQTASANLSYQLTLTATDLVGNPQDGDSLCEPDGRSGAIQGVGPALQGAEVTLTVAPSTYTDGDGRPWAKAGDVVTVTFDVVNPSALDTATSSVALSGLELTPDTAGTTWTVTLDGSEGDGAKNLNARLVDTAGNALVVTRTALTRFDFTPPSASCSIAPKPANGTQTVVFTLAPTETLGEPPSVTSEEVAIEDLAFDGTRWTARIVAPSNADTPYSLDVSATDRVGNTAAGEALCPLADRQGRVNAVAPVASAVTLTVSGANTFQPDSGLPRVGLGAVVEVNLTTSSDLDLVATVVQVGDIRLAHQEGLTWRHTVTTSDLDGPKNLAVSLVDTAGNTAAADAGGQGVVVDLTPPSANCVLFPPVANAEDEVTLQVFASEELLAPPTPSVDHPEVAVTLNPTSTGNPHLFDISLTAPIDVPTYTVALVATDLVGNAQVGDSLCAANSRTGAFFGVPPVLSGDITLTATPSIDEGGTPRAAAGATVTVTIPTEQPISPLRSFVSLSGFALSSTNGTTWTGTLDPILGDGLKTLTATLVDGAGNTLVVQDPTVVVIADFTPPQVASAVLTRTPFFATADDGSGTVFFTTADPLTGQAVSASLRVTTTEDLGEPALLDVHGPAPLTLTPTGGSARLATWSLPTIPEGQDGAYTFEITLEDAVGNRSDPLPLEVTLEIDTTGPEQGPDVQTPDRIVYERQPWGPSSTSGTPSFRVYGVAGAAPPGVLVIAENASGGQLGSGMSSVNGSFELTLGADLPSVFLRTHDEAGNPSPRSSARYVDWTATLLGKILGSTRGNPHLFYEAPLATKDLTPPRLIKTREHATISVDSIAEPPWLPWAGTDAAGEEGPARNAHALAYDSARGVTVLFGGVGLSSGGCGTPSSFICSDTWEWDGITWTEVTPDTSPPRPRATRPGLRRGTRRHRALWRCGHRVWRLRHTGSHRLLGYLGMGRQHLDRRHPRHLALCSGVPRPHP